MLKVALSKFLISFLMPLLVMLAPAKEAPAEAVQEAVDFAGLLNLNCSYGVELTDEDIAYGSMLSLLELAKEENGGLVLSVEQVDTFSKAYYGRTVSYEDCGLEVVDGQVLIPAMGYDIYTHELVDTVTDGDTVKVTTKVVCDGHDEVYDALCVSVFVKNDNSVFGYNLISSEILA